MVADFQKKQKRNPQKQFLIICGGIIILVVIVLLIIANVRIYKRKAELNSQIENLKTKIEEIKNQNKDLEQGILKVNDDNYIEKIAREDLGLQKEGEKAVSFIMPKEKNQENSNQSKNFLQNWLGWLSGIWQWLNKL